MEWIPIQNFYLEVNLHVSGNMSAEQCFSQRGLKLQWHIPNETTYSGMRVSDQIVEFIIYFPFASVCAQAGWKYIFFSVFFFCRKKTLLKSVSCLSVRLSI